MRVRSAVLAALLACPAPALSQATAADSSTPRPPAARDSVRPGRINAALQATPSATLRETPATVRFGKWGAAAIFAGGMAAGVLQHEAADDKYDDLRGYCTAGGQCTIGSDGRYTDPGAEALYQEVVTADRAARAFFVVGQVAFAGAVTLFIIQLRYERGPRNIPLSSLIIEPGRQTTRLGVRLPIRGP